MANDQRGYNRRPGATFVAPVKVGQPLIQSRIAQLNAAQRQIKPNGVTVSHINQHSAYLQRAAQAKLAQRSAIHKPAAPNPPLQAKVKNSVQASRSASVVQRSCIVDAFVACWRGICGPSSNSRQQNYQPIADERRDVQIVKPVTVKKKSGMVDVDETKTVTQIEYGSSVVSNLITGCALVIFCHDDDFDCYHPSGGRYYSNSIIRRNPNRIFYVYKAEKSDKSDRAIRYQGFAAEYQRSVGGTPPVTVYGHLDGMADIWVKVNSGTSIEPMGGSFV